MYYLRGSGSDCLPYAVFSLVPICYTTEIEQYML
jgi:hypothetical protein